MEGIIGVERCPLYLKPALDSAYADEGIYGMACCVVGEDLDFYEVEMEYSYRGYILKKAFQLCSQDLWKSRRNALVIAPSADVLPAPTYKGAPCMTLPRGAFIVYRGESDVHGWVEIGLADGTHGFMRKEWIRVMSLLVGRTDSETRSAIAEDAKRYTGTIYKWGGKTPQGIDCSGLTFMAYWLNGLMIYRDAKIVEGFAVHPIAENNIKLGDLMFYEGHVALYLGEGLFIHSKGGCGGVVVHSLNPEDMRYSPLNNQMLLAVGSIFNQEAQNAYS